MKTTVLIILAALSCLTAWAGQAGMPPPIILEAEDESASRLFHARSREMNKVHHSGRAYWVLYGANEQLTYRFTAPAGKYHVWLRAWLDSKEAVLRRRLSLTLGNRLIGYLEKGNDRSQGSWTWHRLGPAALPGGNTSLKIKKLLNSARPAAIDVIHLSRDPRYRPPGG